MINTFSLQTSETEEKLDDIRDELQAQLNNLCGCGLTPQHITAGELQCFTSSTEVTYRAKINGTATNSSSGILAYLEVWIHSGTASLLVQGFRFFLDSSCLPVVIGSFSDPECESEGSPSDAKGSEDNTTAIVGGVVAVVVIIALTLIIVIGCLVVRSRRRAKFSVHKGER